MNSRHLRYYLQLGWLYTKLKPVWWVTILKHITTNTFHNARDKSNSKVKLQNIQSWQELRNYNLMLLWNCSPIAALVQVTARIEGKKYIKKSSILQ